MSDGAPLGCPPKKAALRVPPSRKRKKRQGSYHFRRFHEGQEDRWMLRNSYNFAASTSSRTILTTASPWALKGMDGKGMLSTTLCEKLLPDAFREAFPYRASRWCVASQEAVCALSGSYREEMSSTRLGASRPGPAEQLMVFLGPVKTPTGTRSPESMSPARRLAMDQLGGHGKYLFAVSPSAHLEEDAAARSSGVRDHAPQQAAVASFTQCRAALENTTSKCSSKESAARP